MQSTQTETEIPDAINLAELNVQEAHLERETTYGHSLWCWGCAACWPESVERDSDIW